MEVTLSVPVPNDTWVGAVVGTIVSVFVGIDVGTTHEGGEVGTR